jgi:hypothetical protein
LVSRIYLARSSWAGEEISRGTAGPWARFLRVMRNWMRCFQLGGGVVHADGALVVGDGGVELVLGFVVACESFEEGGGDLDFAGGEIDGGANELLGVVVAA